MIHIIQFGIIYLIIVDIMMSLLMMIFHRVHVIFSWHCNKCNEEINHSIFSVCIWKTLTHRCENNLNVTLVNGQLLIGRIRDDYDITTR